MVTPWKFTIFKRMLQPENGGVVMVNFYNDYLTCSPSANLSDVAGNLLLYKMETLLPLRDSESQTSILALKSWSLSTQQLSSHYSFGKMSKCSLRFSPYI